MAIYDNNGTADSNVSRIYDCNATTVFQTDKVYDNDGTADSIVYTSDYILYDTGKEYEPITVHLGNGASYTKQAEYIDCCMNISGTLGVDITASATNVDLTHYKTLYADITLMKYGANSESGRAVFILGVSDKQDYHSCRGYSPSETITVTSAECYRRIVSLDISEITGVKVNVGCGVRGQTYNGARFYLHKLWME